MKIFINFFTFIIFLLLLISNNALASTSEIEYKITPSYPRAYEIVDLDLKTNYFDLDNSEIFYYIDDNLIQQGFGLKNFIFKTKNVGQKTNIKVEVKKFNDEIIAENINITPAEASLVYEVQDPYRPFGYKGKSVALSDSKVKIYVYTNFRDVNDKKINSEKLIFN